MLRMENKANVNTVDFWDQFYTNPEFDYRKRLQFYIQCLKHIKGNSLLEIGCGTGYGLKYILEKTSIKEVAGCDLSAAAIEKARLLLPDRNLYQCDIQQENAFMDYDNILLLETLEHLEQPYSVIDKLLCFCRRLIITTPYNGHGLDEKTHINIGFYPKSFKRYGIIEDVRFRKGLNLMVVLKGCL